LTGTLTRTSAWPEGDWRNIYFNREHLDASLARVDRLTPLVPDGMDLPELALRFILEHPAVSTTIPGMRRPAHVERNLAASDGVRLPPRLAHALKSHRSEERRVGKEGRARWAREHEKKKNAK